jgi:hypothetical protein
MPAWRVAGRKDLLNKPPLAPMSEFSRSMPSTLLTGPRPYLIVFMLVIICGQLRVGTAHLTNVLAG